MISKSQKNERAEFLAEGIDAETIGRRFIEAPMEAARQPAIGTGLELLSFMSSLPDAFIASERRELKRLARTAESKNDARIERLKISIERAQEIRGNADLGKTRIERALVSLSEDGNVFHGFVSDTELQPRKGLTVRIVDARSEKTGKSFSATTDADGYFSIALGKDVAGGRKSNTPEADVKLSDRMAELLSRVNAKADTAAGSDKSYAETGNQNEVLAQVEILDTDGKILYQDLSPLVINTGTAYREYAIDGNEPVTPYEPGKYSKTETVKPAASKAAVDTAADTRKASSPGKKATGNKAKK